MLVYDGIICLLWKIEDYPSVERKPETDPSAYREIMSPMWRKEAVPAISMFQIWPNLLMNCQTYDLPHREFGSRSPFTPLYPIRGLCWSVSKHHNVLLSSLIDISSRHHLYGVELYSHDSLFRRIGSHISVENS